MKNILKKINKNKDRGFTLIELLLTIGISTTILSFISFFMINILEVQVKHQTIADVEEEGTRVLNLITKTIRNAENITSPLIGTSSSSITIDVLNTPLDPTIFDLSTGVIRIKEGLSTPIPITSDRIIISDLSFQNLSYTDTPGIIRVSFTASRTNSTGRKEYSFAKDFYTSVNVRE